METKKEAYLKDWIAISQEWCLEVTKVIATVVKLLPLLVPKQLTISRAIYIDKKGQPVLVLKDYNDKVKMTCVIE